tara:strand:+ start:346 stop:768 length:423 start_codon:yes stop_codon:yes gene_type:complete
MTSAFHRLLKKLVGVALAICLGFGLILTPFGQSVEAGRTSMSGDYLTDTVNVAHSLLEQIEANQSPEEKEDTVELITDYISRYRNRSQVNSTMSFTTMQTALNALAGHYKTFSNRPVPEKLKERLNKELSKAEELVSKES